ncbi:IS3 family transposase [Streptomyces sp. XD-27]|uniref:IS3 family transposase n=1 Tax=Streptomyces sp. XD-27 TaxID=3062779 RepID=UPI00350E5143
MFRTAPTAGRSGCGKPGSTRGGAARSSRRNARSGGSAWAERVRCFFDYSGRTYGSPRITLDLCEEGWQVSPNTVADIVAELGLQGRTPPRRRRSMARPGKRKAAPALVRRTFRRRRARHVVVGRHDAGHHRSISPGLTSGAPQEAVDHGRPCRRHRNPRRRARLPLGLRPGPASWGPGPVLGPRPAGPVERACPESVTGAGCAPRSGSRRRHR